MVNVRESISYFRINNKILILILDQMEEGISVSKKKFMLRIEDRAAAIQTACLLAKPNDIILIAGKGHETYQEINGIKHPFDDAQMIVDFFKTLEK